jgi:hypothetical protein
MKKILNRNLALIVGVVLLIQLLLLYSTQFTAWPEMLLWPYLVLKGWLPYRDIAIAHNPLNLVALSGFYSVFGVGIEQLRIFTYLLIAILDVLVYVMANKLFNRRVAIFAFLLYFPLQILYEGNGLWFDLVMGIFAISSFYFIRTKRYFWAGVLWGLAFMTKQTAFWFLFPLAFNFSELPLKKNVVSKVSKLLTGMAGVLILSFIIIYSFGIWRDYVYWTIYFGIFTLPRAAGQVNLPTLRQVVVYLYPFSILLPIFFTNKKKDWDLPVWAAAGIMGAYPRFELFHFQPALPFLAIAGGLVVSKVNNYKSARNIVFRNFVILYLLAFGVLFVRSTQRSWGKEVRFYDSEVQQVAEYVRNNTSTNQPIYVLNYWDNIYALTDTLPAAKPWYPYLPWYINLPGVENEIVDDLNNTKPNTVVIKEPEGTGLASFKAEEMYSYIQDNYSEVNKVDGVSIYELN